VVRAIHGPNPSQNPLANDFAEPLLRAIELKFSLVAVLRFGNMPELKAVVARRRHQRPGSEQLK
jgi:hypothetical protein